MREIACDQCGRRVTIGGDAVMCPSCGFTVRPEAQPPAAAPMGTEISGMETRVAAAPVALSAPPAIAAGGQTVCAQCGRGVMTDAGMAAVCPSCGFALSAPAVPAAPDVSAMETRVAPAPALPAPIAVPVETPAPAGVSADGASGRDAAATRVAEMAPVAAATQADTAATQVAAVQPPAPAPSPGQPAFGQPVYGQQPQQSMPPTATYPYPGHPGGPMMAPVPPPSPQSKKTPTALIAVLVALAVVVVAGVLFAALALARPGGLGGASATAVPTATATAIPTATPSPTASIANVPAGFTAFQDSAGIFQIAYPAGWTKTSTSGDLGLTLFAGPDASGHANVLEVEYIKGAPPGDLTTLSNTFFSTIADQAHGSVSNKQGPAQVSLAGESWSRESGDVTGTATGFTQTQHVVVQVASHGGYTFVIAYFAPAASFDAASASTFKPMLDSFAFLK